MSDRAPQDEASSRLRQKITAPPRTPADAEGFGLAPDSASAEAGRSDAADGAAKPAAHREQRSQSAVLAEAVVRQALAEDPVETQFTLRDLFVLVTVCGLLSLPLSRLPRPMFAGLIGGVTVLWMFLQSFFAPRHALVRYGWWLLLCLYLLACGMAVLGV